LLLKRIKNISIDKTPSLGSVSVKVEIHGNIFSLCIVLLKMLDSINRWVLCSIRLKIVAVQVVSILITSKMSSIYTWR
jgi:hypothetical protein